MATLPSGIPHRLKTKLSNNKEEKRHHHLINSMPTFQLYDKLLGLPLFQGMSKADLATIVGQTKFGFHQFAAGEAVVKEHMPCSHLHFLLTGTLTVESVADDHGYRLIEHLDSPAVLQPEHLFGLHQYYTRTFIAETNCQLITLSKSEVMRLTEEFIIFQLNIFNILSTRSQKKNRQLWHLPPSSLSSHIARFISTRCLHTKGEKILYIKMTRLAEELNDSRLDISHALNELQEQGLIELHRGRIIIPAMEQLAAQCL